MKWLTIFVEKGNAAEIYAQLMSAKNKQKYNCSDSWVLET